MKPEKPVKNISLLIVEDSEDDAAILVREIRSGGFEPSFQIVWDEAGMRKALESKDWDIITSDYVLPGFSGLDALALLKSYEFDIPFIVVSGKVGEETAVEAMRNGASDYIIKGRLSRLNAVIDREISEASLRKNNRKNEQELYLLRRAVDNLSLGLSITDSNRRIIYVNRAEAELHGYTVEELTGESARVFAPPNTWLEIPFHHLPDDSVRRRETINVRKDGSTFPAYIISNVVKNLKGAMSEAMVTCCEDITERKAMELTFRRQMTAIESAMDCIIIVDEDGSLTYLNQACAETYGYNLSADLVGKNWGILFESGEKVRIKEEMFPLLESQNRWRGELIGKRRHGALFPMEISITKVEGNGYVSVFRDISERKLAEERLSFLSTHDPLTGFYNRFYFEEEIARLKKGRNYPVSIIMMDIDGLKQVNDTMGHHSGDELLRNSARAISAAFRNEDIIARIGGDEFIVLLPGTDTDAVEKAVERILNKIEMVNKNLKEGKVSISIGYATAHKGEDINETIKISDKLMYDDKKSRRVCRNSS